VVLGAAYGLRMASLRWVRTHKWARRAATALAFPLVLVVASALSLLLGGDELNLVTAALHAVPVAVYAAVVARAWVLLLPLVWAALYLGVTRLVDLITGGCTPCGPESEWATYPLFFFVLVVVPLTGAVLVGLVTGAVLRRIWRFGT